jgi:hypothetical protein
MSHAERTTFRIFLSLPLLCVVAVLAKIGAGFTRAAKWLYRGEE